MTEHERKASGDAAFDAAYTIEPNTDRATALEQPIKFVPKEDFTKRVVAAMQDAKRRGISI